jgi:hypothetical protein
MTSTTILKYNNFNSHDNNNHNNYNNKTTTTTTTTTTKATTNSMSVPHHQKHLSQLSTAAGKLDNNSNNNKIKIALINKIRAIESRKKTMDTYSKSPTNLNSKNDVYLSKQPNNSLENSHTQFNFEVKIKPKSPPLLMDSRMSTNIDVNKLRKKLNHSESPSMGRKDQYKDKISDSKFFSRNFKLNETLANYDGINVLSNNSSPTRVSLNQSPTTPQNPFNKLKLLKKRNENKKTIVNSLEDIDLVDQYLKRLNRSDNTLNDDSMGKSYKTGVSASNSQLHTTLNTPSNRSKSDNYLAKSSTEDVRASLRNILASNEDKPVIKRRSPIRPTMITSKIKTELNRPANSALLTHYSKKTPDATNAALTYLPKQQASPIEDDFRIAAPGGYVLIRKPEKPVVRGVGMDYQDNEIEYDPQICEELERLFKEDEYFKNVYNKCVNWLNNHVVPNMPRITAKLKRQI